VPKEGRKSTGGFIGGHVPDFLRPSLPLASIRDVPPSPRGSPAGNTARTTRGRRCCGGRNGADPRDSTRPARRAADTQARMPVMAARSQVSERRPGSSAAAAAACRSRRPALVGADGGRSSYAWTGIYCDLGRVVSLQHHCLSPSRAQPLTESAARRGPAVVGMETGQ
jgi:hypothetical protein